MAEILAVIVLACVLTAREAMHHAELRRRDRRESELLNRIKPETAQPIPGVQVDDKPAVDLFDDTDWQRAHEELRHGSTA